MTNLNGNSGWEEVDISAELEKANVQFEQEHKDDISVSVLPEPKVSTFQVLGLNTLDNIIKGRS
jgi:hypothetical protein